MGASLLFLLTRAICFDWKVISFATWIFCRTSETQFSRSVFPHQTRTSTHTNLYIYRKQNYFDIITLPQGKGCFFFPRFELYDWIICLRRLPWNPAKIPGYSWEILQLIKKLRASRMLNEKVLRLLYITSMRLQSSVRPSFSMHVRYRAGTRLSCGLVLFYDFYGTYSHWPHR